MSKIILWALGVFILFAILAKILRKLKVAFAISLLLGVCGFALSIWSGLFTGKVRGEGPPQKVEIRDILRNPADMTGKFVEVEGKVSTGWGFLGRGFYRLEEKGDAIWVQTFTSIPPKGRRLKVRGVIKAGVVISSKPFFIWLAEGERSEAPKRPRRERD